MPVLILRLMNGGTGTWTGAGADAIWQSGSVRPWCPARLEDAWIGAARTVPTYPAHTATRTAHGEQCEPAEGPSAALGAHSLCAGGRGAPGTTLSDGSWGSGTRMTQGTILHCVQSSPVVLRSSCTQR